MAGDFEVSFLGSTDEVFTSVFLSNFISILDAGCCLFTDGDFDFSTDDEIDFFWSTFLLSYTYFIIGSAFLMAGAGDGDFFVSFFTGSLKRFASWSGLTCLDYIDGYKLTGFFFGAIVFIYVSGLGR